MTHLKRCGPIRQGRFIKRTSLVEIQGEEIASNSPQFRAIHEECQADARSIVSDQQRRDAAMFSGPLGEDFFRRADSSEPSAAQKAAREADAAQSLELARMPMGGYLNN